MPFSRTTRLLFFSILWFSWCGAQNYPVNRFTAATNLPNNSIRSLLVDSGNALWIGTENGVVKKENDELKYFFEEDGLALNSCWAIAEDRNKNLWFGSYGKGISIYDGYNFKVISKKNGLVHNEVIKLFPFQNLMFVGTSDGLSIVNIDNLEIWSLNDPSKNELFRVSGFFEFRGKIYVATYRSGIYRIDFPNGQPALKELHDYRFIYSVFTEKDSIYSSNKGFFTKTPLTEYLEAKDSLTTESFGNSIIWDYVKTKDNRKFVAAWGIYDSNGGIYELKNGKMISRASEFNIPSKEVISLAYDPSFDRLYVGTKDAGLYEIVLNPQIAFTKVNSKKVLGFAKTGNVGAVLLNDGIFLKENDRGKTIELSQLKEWEENYLFSTPIPLPKHRDGFYELDYSTKAEDIKFYDIKAFHDQFWVNTSIGIFAINKSGSLDRYLPLHSEEINFTPQGNLIETNPYGGARVYRDLDEFTYTRYEQEDPATPTMIVNSLHLKDKTYFLSVFSGLYVWENNNFKSFVQEGIWKEQRLRHITALGNDLAISTEFGDVFIVNDGRDFKVLKKINRAQIEGNTIAFLKAHKETLLIGTEKGLTLYNKGKFIFLDKEQGLEQPLITATVHEDNLYVGSNNGYYKIDLLAITGTKNRLSDIDLKEIHVNNSKLSLGPLPEKKNLSLEHDENTVLLKFSTNAHPYPRKLKYQYRLNPSEKWSLPNSKPEIFLPFLPEDHYEVAVKVVDQSTGLSYSDQVLDLTILPPFWKTWWFILLICVSGVLLVYTFYRIQILQTRRFEAQKGLIQKRFEETKMEALLAQMNPHFIFNAMNSIQYYIMEKDIDNATSFLGDFSKLIRLNLDHCTKPKILLIEEIEYLQSYIRVENTRFNNNVKVEMQIDPAIDIYEVEIPTMILQTFVENVFVHAFPPGVKDPILKISFKMISENTLQCKVEDNGVGISSDKPNRLHHSKGIKLVKERLALLGYDVTEAVKVTSIKNKGTSVKLLLNV